MIIKKKSHRILLCICSILVIFASVFAIIPFKKDIHIVKADTSVVNYSFNGSPLYTKISPLVNDSFITPYDIALSYTFSTDSLGYINTIGIAMSFYDGGYHERSYNVTNNLGYLDYTYGTRVYRFGYQFSSDRLMGIPIGFELECSSNAYNESVFSIRYFDKDNNFLLMYHTFICAISGYYELSPRIYYFESAFNLTDNDYYNQGYNEGYREGYMSGENTGLNTGYTNGYNTGKNDGYDLGYNTALENDTYTFTNLMSSIIDVPVRTFTSLFNFEILGVNLSGFFLGLLTCCIVIGVIRLIL